MNKKDLKFEGVSKNLRYIFTDKGVIPMGDYFNNNGNMITYSPENIHHAVQIMKEHEELYYKAGKTSLMEYANSARKFLYSTMGELNSRYSTTLINEWESHCGSKLLLLNESTDKLIIESRIQKAWDGITVVIMEGLWDVVKSGAKWVGNTVKKGVENVSNYVSKKATQFKDWSKEQVKQIREKGFLNYAWDKAKAVYNKVKDAVVAAWNCLTNNFVECLMEGIRAAAFSAVGMGVMTAITFIPGVGQIADALVFGSLLIWDIYKMLSGKYESGKYQWSWVDIIIDAVCLILPALGAGLKFALKGAKSLAQIGAKAVKGSIVGKAVSAVIKGISKIGGLIGSAAKWIGDKLGIKWLSKWGTKAESTMSKAATDLEKTTAKEDLKNLVTKGKDKIKNIPKNVSKDVSKGVKDFKQFVKNGKLTQPMPYVLKASGKTVLITATLCAALGLDAMSCAHKAENGEITDEQIAEAQEALESGTFRDTLNTASVEDAEAAGLF